MNARTKGMLAIPNDPWLVEQAWFVQGLVFDPPANPLGLTVSNTGELVVGVQ